MDVKDLRERLSQAAATLDEMAEPLKRATERHEHHRLKAKAEGVRLAISYLDEATR